MNKRILSIGFIVAIIFAVTAFPTGNGLPTGIGNENQVVNGCTCHTGGENGNVAIILQDLPEIYNVSKNYTLTLNISGGPPEAEWNKGGFFIQASHGTLHSIDDGYVEYTSTNDIGTTSVRREIANIIIDNYSWQY